MKRTDIGSPKAIFITTTALCSVLCASPAFAQIEAGAIDAPLSGQSSPENQAIEDIVVTGSLIRGIAPAGAATIGLNEDAIAATGATTTAQLLANVPQLASFNSVPTVSGGAATASINRVNLRNLPGSTGGGSSTLVLVDGHRLPGMGVLQTAPDPDAIAPGAIERVEIVPDGGSSTYGADAVGGVVNFITRKSFDGIEANGRIGFGDNYTTGDANFTVGKKFDAFSIYATYSFSKRDSIYGRDRDYVTRRDYIADAPLDLTCVPGNVIANGSTYALPALAAGTSNRCDNSDDKTFFPSEERHSIYAGLSIDDGGPVTFNLRGFYTNRVNKSNLGPYTGSTTISPSSPYYRNIAGADADAVQTVFYNFASATGDNVSARAELETWQIAPSMTADLGGGWQLRTLFTYGKGVNRITNSLLDTGMLANLVAAGQFNPYDTASPVNTPYISELTNYGEYAFGRNELANARVTADGALFALPGGDIRLAVGAEYLYEKYTGIDYTGSLSAIETLVPGSAQRHTTALFGEMQIPIVGPSNNFTAVNALNISLSGRYDHYSDFGGTFNPRVGLTYEPVEWISLRGSWGKSFQAPSLADSASAAGSSIITIPFVVFASPDVTPVPGQAQIFLSGGGANLKPQKARTYSIGGEIKPPFLEGLKLGLSYYNIRFKDLIGIPPVFNPSIFYALYPELYVLNPTAEQVKAFAAQAQGGSNAVAPYTVADGQVYSIADGRRFNQANVKVSGLDFNLNYDQDTGFGSIFAALNGNYVLTRKEQTRVGAPVTDSVNLYPRLSFATTVGAKFGSFTAQATLNHTGSSDLVPVAATLDQAKLKSFNVVNLFFQYEFQGEGMSKDLALTLGVNNLFDQDPPIWRTGDGYDATKFTLGRVVQLGVSKKF